MFSAQLKVDKLDALMMLWEDFEIGAR